MALKSINSKTSNTWWFIFAILLLVCLIAAILYLGAASYTYRLGFPLDDAWIHQTFARNLIIHQQWSYNEGEPTSGSTSPMWTAMLAFGYLLGVNNLWWSYSLGFLLLLSTGLLSEKIVRLIVKEYAPKIPWVGIIVCSEWHLVWAAFSGMEVLLSCVVLLIIILLSVRSNPNWIVVGIFLGIGVWARPDSLIWASFILWWIIANQQKVISKLKSILYVLFGFSPWCALYVAFNYYLSKSIFPNTMNAKQIEYLELTKIFILNNFVRLFSQLLIGIGIILLPGFIYKLFLDIKSRQWNHLAFVILIISFTLVYSWKLPVTYQYGRYLMPLIPIYLIYGYLGLILIKKNYFKTSNKAFVLLRFAFHALLACIVISFTFIGIKRYSLDVATIESELVNTAKYLQKFIPKDESIAAHDIGALGYFGEHRIIDLAGLITPEVIPIIREEAELINYLKQSKIKYLMTFQNWYPQIDSMNLTILYQSKHNFATSQGQGRVVVYRILP